MDRTSSAAATAAAPVAHDATALTPRGTVPSPDERGALARPRGVAAMLLITSLVALAATIIIIVERALLAVDPNHRTSCDLNPWMSCGKVMQSWQAGTFGFPNTYVGIVGFSVLITVAVSLFSGARFARWYWLLMNLGILAGLGFAVWLWYAAVYQINTLCLYCMIVWAMVIIQAVMVTSATIQNGLIPASEGLRSRAREFAWPVVVLLYLAVAASIVLRFGLGVLGL
ncbi:vitamin K epoxide reductase family protein [Micrococcus lylae]|uniref:Vitamin K epoxide reductase family protein n=1 Tax=Micrococcus lylae TaxID=1273 RepID=A0ABY2JXZ0_9MICC|nr:vitamin K epoxide reductase family protein [Micrococcus lylae]TFH98337.1 vitamin K epoxide reductase family protein [Micrococcus lylae]